MAGKILAAYYSDGALDKRRFTKEDIQKLTHVNWAFAVLKDGRVVGDHLKNVAHLHKFRAFNPRLKTLLSIGGWGAGGFSEAASTPEGRELFAVTALELMEKFEFDGLDIDWEYPGIPAAGIGASAQDKENFTKMLQLIRQKLDDLERERNRRHLLTIAAGAYQHCLENMEIEVIARDCVDFINLMTYDLGSGRKLTHHHTGLYSPAEPLLPSVQQAVEMYSQAGVPHKKLVIGGAFYARKWSGVPNIENGLYQEAETGGLQTVDYSELLDKYLGKQGYHRYWDEQAQAPYLFNGESFLSYDDPQSLTAKAAFVKEQGLLGIMFWEYPLDKSGTLLEALYQELRGD